MKAAPWTQKIIEPIEIKPKTGDGAVLFPPKHGLETLPDKKKARGKK